VPANRSHPICNSAQHCVAIWKHTATHCTTPLTPCNTLQRIWTLQHTAKRRCMLPLCKKIKKIAQHRVAIEKYSNTLQRCAILCITMQHIFDSVQHTAAHCKTLQLNWTLRHTTKHRCTLQHNATQYNTLPHTTTQCNSIPHSNTLQHTATHCITLQHTATHYNAKTTRYIPISVEVWWAWHMYIYIYILTYVHTYIKQTHTHTHTYVHTHTHTHMHTQSLTHILSL